VDRRRVRVAVDRHLLVFEDAPVLHERLVDLPEDALRHFRALGVYILRLTPEIVAGPLGLRRDRVEIAQPETARRRLMLEVDPADGPRSGGLRPGEQAHEAGRVEADDLPAIDI